MRKVSVEYEVYKYNELDKDAKENVKQWYLDGQSDLSFIFTEDCEQDLENLFPNSDLEVQYSLGYCQGDGFNIYGTVNAEDIIKCIESGYARELEEYKDYFTDKEKKTILAYQEVCDDIKLEYNNRYCYCLADYIDIVDSWEYDLEYNDYSNVNTDVLEKFEHIVRVIFSTLCDTYEKNGYSFFYEVEECELNDICDSNDYEFLSNGALFTLA